MKETSLHQVRRPNKPKVKSSFSVGEENPAEYQGLERASSGDPARVSLGVKRP
jgi:hypothetical protein